MAGDKVPPKAPPEFGTFQWLQLLTGVVARNGPWRYVQGAGGGPFGFVNPVGDFIPVSAVVVATR